MPSFDWNDIVYGSLGAFALIGGIIRLILSRSIVGYIISLIVITIGIIILRTVYNKVSGKGNLKNDELAPYYNDAFGGGEYRLSLIHI